MLTLLDLHNQEFRRAFRGYDCEEVDTYMVQVIESYEIMTLEQTGHWSKECR